ncbi:MAG: transcription antitermination factor NusB [Candidatus Thermofonsia Clade 3 bacterium]|jgi:N utilization substance protein B|uniref:Transcription antitermination protein NusB n=1 Tax=Candidatus Thermofonsia Clade 3 bacterium TaxID=2364212 RepID=A0A2M8QGE3_9CHLR|nr:transcription antitermination factor NusB [Candidatus Roseilinea sp. NK_OTU-006]PJF48895.1 MAG: transcription antitermination factor NusB [Candidatus Thermofonsia Clade 3 bacterium]
MSRISRRDARVLALQTLYEADTARHPADEVLNRHLAQVARPAAVRQYAIALVQGVMREATTLDQMISALAPKFPADQLSAIDRNILRIALYEMREGEVPLEVAISEAVNIAKEFGSETSARFVNGVLGAAANL